MRGADRFGYLPRSPSRRIVAAGVAIVVFAFGYILMLRHFNVSELPVERHFGASGAVKPVAEVYLEPVSIDALNEAMQVRAYLSPTIAEGGSAHPVSDRDLTLSITHDNTVEEVKLAAANHLATANFEIDLTGGSVTHYPLDSYRARLAVQLFDAKSATVRLPVRVTTWDGTLGYDLHTTAQPGSGPDDVNLTTDVARSGAFALFALCAYGAMVVLGGCALVVGILTFIDLRRPEATLVGALAAIAFALPVLRNALPGSPPLGVEADMFVFLWTELAAVLALALLVFKWAQAGPRP